MPGHVLAFWLSIKNRRNSVTVIPSWGSSWANWLNRASSWSQRMHHMTSHTTLARDTITHTVLSSGDAHLLGRHIHKMVVDRDKPLPRERTAEGGVVLQAGLGILGGWEGAVSPTPTPTPIPTPSANHKPLVHVTRVKVWFD